MKSIVSLVLFFIMSLASHAQLTVSPATITFGVTAPGDTSDPSIVTCTGYYLTPAAGSITVTAPTGFEVNSGSGWVSSYTIGYTASTLYSTTARVSFRPSSAASYTGNLVFSGGGYYAAIVLNGIAALPCTGSSPGVIVASTYCVTSATTLSLALSGHTIGAGATYQWQSSSDSISYSNISGATNDWYNRSGITSTTWFKCVVSCGAGGTSYTYRAKVIASSSCPDISISPGSISFATTSVGSSSSISYINLSASNLSPATGSVTLTMPSGYEINNGSAWVSSLGISYSSSAISSTSIPVRFTPIAEGTAAGNLTAAGGTASTFSSLTGTAPCFGTPSAGTASSTVASAGTSSTVTLLNTGYSAAPGIGHQWQSASAATGPWSNISGATTAVYTFTGITATTYYRCNVTCGYSSLTDSTAAVLVTYIPTCSGTPAGGTTSFSATSSACGITTVTLNNSGYTAIAGIDLQWQVSPTGSSGSWTNIAGATSATYISTGATTTRHYQCAVHCMYGGLTGYSTPSMVSVDRINGHITFTSTPPDTLDMKVWLIYHNISAGTLTAIDSTTTCIDGSLPYYEFNSMGTGSYLVKAKSLDYTSTIVGGSGIIPTYGLSNPHWDTGVVINHTNPVDTMQINMVYGTVPSGPGFIGGLITSGAGKNTAADIPAVNMIVYLMDASRHVLTYCYTNSTGNYSFSNLGYGNYIIYPEDLNYTTTPSSIITLSAGTASVTGTDFKQYTGSKTIKPVLVTQVDEPGTDNNYCVIYPNPATDELTVKTIQGAYQSCTVLNAVGTVVLQQPMTGVEVKLNMKQLSGGVYTVKLAGEKGSIVRKIVKQ